MKKNFFDIAIIGAGASGSYLASLLSDTNLNVALVDSNDRIGKKLALTGNGQGNVSNANMDCSKYISLAQRDDSLINEIINSDVLSHFNTLFDTDEKGRIYPNSRQASSIVDLLRFSFKPNITLLLGLKVENVEGNYKLSLSNGEVLFSKKLVVATGGIAQSRLGSSGYGYEIAKKYGHNMTFLYPGLVQLKTDTSKIKTLKGKRVEARVSAFSEGKLLASELGDVIFTEYGLTGDAIFRLSPFVTTCEKVSLCIDFFPGVSEADIALMLEKRKELNKEIFTGMVNNMLGRAIVDYTGSLNVRELAKNAKNFKINVIGNLGFDNAQISIGGIKMTELTTNLESKKNKGLYFIGEILDVSGLCGGYNLHFAFASASRVYKALKNDI